MTEPHSDPTEGLPPDLARVLRDPSIIVTQDSAVFELVAKWMNAPSDTASAELRAPEKEDTVTEPTHGDVTDALGQCEVVVNDVRYVRETTLFAAMERLDALEAERDERILTATADEWLAHRFNQEYQRAEAAENLLAKTREYLAYYDGAGRGVHGHPVEKLYREINEFLTRRQ